MTLVTTPGKTANRSLLAWQDALNTELKQSAVLDVSTIYVLALQIRLARQTGAAFTQGWPNVRLEASVQATGDDHWASVGIWTPALGQSIANTTLSAGVSAGAATFAVTAATNIAVGDVLFVGDTAQANYEICKVKALSGTTVTPEYPLKNAHAITSIVTDQAEVFYPSFDVRGFTRVRGICDNLNSGQKISVEVLASSMDQHNSS